MIVCIGGYHHSIGCNTFTVATETVSDIGPKPRTLVCLVVVQLGVRVLSFSFYHVKAQQNPHPRT